MTWFRMYVGALLMMMGCRSAESMASADATGGDALGDRGEPDSKSDALISARHIRMEVPLKRGQVVLRGDTFRVYEESRRFEISGNASLVIEGTQRLAAEADTIEAASDGQVIALSGHVRAGFALPRFEPRAEE